MDNSCQREKFVPQWLPREEHTGGEKKNVSLPSLMSTRMQHPVPRTREQLVGFSSPLTGCSNSSALASQVQLSPNHYRPSLLVTSTGAVYARAQRFARFRACHRAPPRL